MRRVLALAVVGLIVACNLAEAQNTGVPLWGSFETSPFDIVNRQNLNVNLVMPIVSAPSRGTGFNYSLIYDSLIWTKSSNVWTPVPDANGNPTWGWKDNQALGATHFFHNSIACDAPPFVQSPHYFGYTYTDGNGTVHKFGLDFYLVATACGFNTGPKTGYATDGSGYFLDATAANSPILKSPSGDLVVGTSTDPNGNITSGIVVNSTETDYKDTNGRVTLKAVKVSNTVKQYQVLDQTGSYANVIASATYTSFSVKTHFACSGVTEYSATGVFLVTQLTLPSWQSYSFTYEPTPTLSGFVTGRIKTVTLPTGGSYEYDYPTTGNNGINCADGTVTSLTRIITDSAAHTWQFARSGTGFVTTTETAPQLPYDSAANATVFTFSGTQVTSQKIYKGAATGSPVRTINTGYAANGTPSITTTILDDQSTQTKVETDFDANANLTEKREFAWGAGAPGSLARRTTMTYLTGAAYTTANILNRVTQVLVKDGGGAVKARTNITYDSYGSGMTCITGALQHNDGSYGCSFTTRGNPTSITRYADAATPAGGITTNLFYDSLGNVNKTDLNGTVQQQMAFSVATQYAFPDSTTQGPSGGPQLTSSATYNSNTGLIATSTDPNSQVIHYTYDNLRRLTRVDLPDGGQTNLTYNLTANPPNITTSRLIDASRSLTNQTNLDRLGRVAKKILTSDPQNVFTDTTYDNLGRVASVSNPYTPTAPPVILPTESPPTTMTLWAASSK